ncbi:unnamed protein product, partial [Brugia timori]
MFPHTVATTFDNLNQSQNFLNPSAFYPLSGYTTTTTTTTATTTFATTITTTATTTTLIPIGEAQTVFLTHPNTNISTPRTYYHQQYSNFQPSATAAVAATATFLSGNILKNTTITGIPFNTTNKPTCMAASPIRPIIGQQQQQQQHSPQQQFIIASDISNRHQC